MDVTYSNYGYRDAGLRKRTWRLTPLSKWVKLVMSLVNRRVSVLSRTMSRRHESVFDDPDVAAEVAEIHEKFVVVPADKASNNIVFVCKTHYINCLMEELGMSTMTGNPTYNLTAISKDEILQNYRSVMLTFGISLPEEDIDLPKLYWIPKLHKNPYKQRYIAGSAKCSTKPLSQILTRILTAVKEGLQKYCDTAYARSGVNQMWILKNSKELLENLKALSLHSVNGIKSFDFSTLYTTIPHDKLKSKLKEIIHQCCHWLKRHILRSGSLWCATKILRCRCHKDAGISNRQYFCGVRRTDISANNRHTDGY